MAILWGNDKRNEKDLLDNGMVIYDPPAGAAGNNDFTVQVCVEGGAWQNIFCYNAVNMYKNKDASEVRHNMSFAYFDADYKKRIEVKVTKNAGTVESVRVRPFSHGIQHTVEGNSVSFFLDRPRKISVEFNGDIYCNLFIYANSIEENPPKADDANVLYFAPGIHDIGTINLTSNTTLYVAGGAVVKGSIRGTGLQNISIKGRGILTGGSIQLEQSSHISIEGIIVHAAKGWAIVPRDCHDIVIRDIKMINDGKSTDGIDPCGCRNLVIDDVFLRIPDDCISIKCYKASQPNQDITVKNSIFWADAAHGILIGPEGNGTVTERVMFINNDFLEVNSNWWPDSYGVFGITNGDDMIIRDIVFEDCRVDDFTCSNLVCIRIEQNMWVKSPGGPIKNILFRNITYNGRNIHPSVLKGYGAERNIDGVTFENFRINGKVITSTEEGNFKIDGFAENIRFMQKK